MNPRSRMMNAGLPTVLLLLLLAPEARIASAGLAAKGPAKTEAKATTASMGAIGLPQYKEPEAYSVDMVIHSPKADMVMKRFIDEGRIRSEITSGDQDVVMIEMGDEKGTSLMLMPKEKRAMKQSRAATESAMDDKMKKKMKGAEANDAVATPVEVKVEDLGDETLDGRSLKKLRMTVPDGTALGWFDKATGAPARMEGTVNGETTTLEWKNFKAGPQPAKLFEVPKDYELMDMDEMMSKMKGMGGPGGMGGMAGMPGMGGVGGMVGGMGQSMGQNLGGSLGSSLGGMLGGPLGAMAGQYVGGKVGGMIGKKTANALTPGKQ